MNIKLVGIITIGVSIFINSTTPSLAISSNVFGHESETIIISKYNTDFSFLHLIAYGEEHGDVKPWEGFRGWSPRVHYGQFPKDPNITPEPENITKDGKTALPSKKDLQDKNNQEKEKILSKDDDVQPWEGFRGWSPRVPY